MRRRIALPKHFVQKLPGTGCRFRDRFPSTSASPRCFVNRQSPRIVLPNTLNRMKVAAAQISCSLGDPKANLLKVRDFSREARNIGAELIVFPEMTDTGYSMSVI